MFRLHRWFVLLLLWRLAIVRVILAVAVSVILAAQTTGFQSQRIQPCSKPKSVETGHYHHNEPLKMFSGTKQACILRCRQSIVSMHMHMRRRSRFVRIAYLSQSVTGNRKKRIVRRRPCMAIISHVCRSHSSAANPELIRYAVQSWCLVKASIQHFSGIVSRQETWSHSLIPVSGKSIGLFLIHGGWREEKLWGKDWLMNIHLQASIATRITRSSQCRASSYASLVINSLRFLVPSSLPPYKAARTRLEILRCILGVLRVYTAGTVFWRWGEGGSNEI